MSAIPSQSAAGTTLVARFGALGDMVMLTPALEVLSRGGQSPCEVVTSLGMASAVYSGLKSVGAVTLVHSKRTPYAFEPSQRAFVRALRGRTASGRVTSALSFTVVPRVPRLLAKAGLSGPNVVTHQDLPRGELEHDIAYGERMVRALSRAGSNPLPLPPPGEWPCPRLAISASERAETESWLRSLGWEGEPVVLLQSQSRKARRGRWPDANWKELARHVRQSLPEAWVLFTGVPSEAAALGRLANGSDDGRVVSVAGATHFRRLCALASIAHSMVSLDTGPAHVAAAVGCPLVVLFGSEHPLRTRPTALRPGLVIEISALPEVEWPDSRREFAERHLMSDIPIDAVTSAWTDLTSRTTASRLA